MKKREHDLGLLICSVGGLSTIFGLGMDTFVSSLVQTGILVLGISFSAVGVLIISNSEQSES